MDDDDVARLKASRSEGSRSNEHLRSSRAIDALRPSRDVETLRAHREQLAEKRRRLDDALAALDTVAHDDEPAAALRRFVGEASWARWEAKREQLASDAPRAPDRVSASRLALFREIDVALDRDPSGDGARALTARWAALLDEETGGDAETKAAMRKAWANRRNWPDGMRRYVASLYEAEPRAWERVAGFFDLRLPR